MLSIKNATPADISLIRELAMQVWPQTYTPILGNEQVAYMLEKFYTPESLRKQMEEMGHRFIICYSEGQPVAFASWCEEEVSVYKLHKIYIIRGRQGKGTGKAILDHIVLEIKAEGATELRLNVNKYNFPAKAFYEKTGFKILYDEDIDIGNGYFMNDHVMGLKVKS